MKNLCCLLLVKAHGVPYSRDSIRLDTLFFFSASIVMTRETSQELQIQSTVGFGLVLYYDIGYDVFITNHRFYLCMYVLLFVCY